MIKPGDIIETAPGELDEIVGPEGNKIKLGLLTPDPNRESALFSNVGVRIPLLTHTETRDIITSVFRKPSREIWGPDRIKDQDGRGACQGYASAYLEEKVRELDGQESVILSGDFSYSLVNGGRDRGSQLIDGFEAGMEIGYCPEDTPGLVRWEYRKSRMPRAAFEAAPRFRGHEGFVCRTEQEFTSAIAYGWVGVVAVHVAGAYSQLDRYGVSRGGNGVGNHAVCVDDVIWDAQLGLFKFDSPNSWRTTWGDNGRCYYTFAKHFARTIQTHKFYVFPSATIDSQGKNPPPLRAA